jgi:hypothetical protein
MLGISFLSSKKRHPCSEGTSLGRLDLKILLYGYGSNWACGFAGFATDAVVLVCWGDLIPFVLVDAHGARVHTGLAVLTFLIVYCDTRHFLASYQAIS